MAMIQIDLVEQSLRFAPTACPTCGEVENLDTAIEGNWECFACGSEFWITAARVITFAQPDWTRLNIDASDQTGIGEKSLTNT